MVELLGDSIVIPDATCVIVSQEEHEMVHAIPEDLHVKLPVTGLNVEVPSSSFTGGDTNGADTGVRDGSDTPTGAGPVVGAGSDTTKAGTEVGAGSDTTTEAGSEVGAGFDTSSRTVTASGAGAGARIGVGTLTAAGSGADVW